MQNREICEGSQKAKSFLFETAFSIKIGKLDVISKLIWDSISIGNPPIVILHS